MDATKLENSNILITVNGSGIYEISRNKKVVWAYKDPEASHYADRLPNRNTFYNLGWQKKGEDVVREVDHTGKIKGERNQEPSKIS